VHLAVNVKKKFLATPAESAEQKVEKNAKILMKTAEYSSISS
jgi:hypothetical protein